MNNKIPPFCIGQEVEAIKDHSRFLFLKGMRFVVTSVEQSHCGYIITTGSPIPTYYDANKMKCVCGVVLGWDGKECPFSSNMFRAVTPKFQAITFSEINELVTTSTN